MATDTLEYTAAAPPERRRDGRADDADAGIRGVVTGVAAGTLVWLGVAALFLL